MIEELCDNCHKRAGKVVFDDMVGPFFPSAGKRIERFRLIHRLCQWCQGAETKRKNRVRMVKHDG